MSLFRVVLLGFVVMLLGACSSSSNNNIDNNGSDGSGETVLTGQLIDSAVSGVRYATESRSGVTDSDGQFEYLQGETVRFYLGDLMLGDARGAAIVSLFDLVDGVTPVVGVALERAIWEWRRGPSFSTVINLATLLQTLDSDGDPENGIDISPEVAALFTANSVDFNQHWEDFSYDPGFSQAMAQAKARNLLDADRQTRKPWRAIAHLYASLGVASELRVRSGSSTDNDADGTPDSTVSYTFDAEGKLVRLEYDYDGDGMPDSVIVYTYDADANLVRDEQDSDNDGTPDYIASYTYDADGNQSGREQDLDGDGMADEVAVYTYDDNGNRTRQESDTDGDGSADLISSDTYDDQGNLTRSEQDFDGDGAPEQISSYQYDARGNRTRAEQDIDADGTADNINTNFYDADDNLLRIEYDRDGDGSPDSITTYNYDEAGNQTGYTYDDDADGTPGIIVSRTFDANGNETSYSYDADGDGMPESVVATIYDEDGYEVRSEHDIDADGTVDLIIEPTYDADADGWWTVFNQGFTPLGFLMTVSVSSDPSGSTSDSTNHTTFNSICYCATVVSSTVNIDPIYTEQGQH